MEYKFIPTVLNATFDMSLWANNSRETPNRVLGGMQCELFQDLTNVWVCSHNTPQSQLIKVQFVGSN